MLNITTPKIEQRGEEHYVAIRTHVFMKDLGELVPPLIPEVFGWLKSKGIKPKGPAFFRYLVIDPENKMAMEAGVLVSSPVKGDNRVQSGTVPAGTYVTMLHTGHPAELYDATSAMLAWGDKNSVSWSKSQEGPTGEAWGARFEFYLSGPDDEPDIHKWKTELAFLTTHSGK